VTTTWYAVLAASLLCYAFKIGGHSVPRRFLEQPVVLSVADYLPIALLSALVAVQTFAIGQDLVLDARVAALGAAGVALWLRAPFLVVVLVAAATAAGLRALGLAA
jgi:uncharacterized membrane protein